MPEPYQQMAEGTELATLETKATAEAKAGISSSSSQEAKGDRFLPVKVSPEDWPVDLYHPVRSTNWTREPIKYHPSQQELMFLDRTFCQFMSGFAALFSACFGLATLAYYPWWVVCPYVFTIWGLFVGCTWDIYNECVPGNRWFAGVHSYRALNAGFVATFGLNHLIFTLTSDYNYIAYAVPLDAWYFVLFMVATYLGFSDFLGHHKGPGPMIVGMLFSFVTQLIILISAKVEGIPEFDSMVTFSGWILLMAFTILNQIGLLVGIRLALYHSIMCISLFCLTFSLLSYGEQFCFNTRYGEAQPNFWYIFLGWVIGMGLVFAFQPLQRNTFRRGLLALLWFRVWAKSLSLPPWDPVPLDLKKNKNQPFIGIKAFWLGSRVDDVSGYRRAAQLCIPMGEFIPSSQFDRIDGSSVAPIFGKGGLFDQLSYLDARFAQSRSDTQLIDKVRFAPGQDGAYWFPSRLLFTGPAPSPTTSVMQAKLQGTLLEFLVWYGHLSPALRKVNDSDREIMGDLEGATHVVDYEWMSVYDVKPDYHRNGGRAFFKLDKASVRLHVLYLTRPRETRKIYPLRLASGETDWQFDQAEQIILTSSYAMVVVGYHAGGIHVMMNLLAIALHNGFDTNDGDYFHPWRTAMHLHFFNHIVVNDSTTGHLLENTAIFSQIFPWTIRGLYEFLQHVVRNFEYMSDADLESRKAVTDGVMPEQSTLVWEEKYKTIYLKYAEKIADLCWKTDADITKDMQMQKFLRNLASNIPKGLPARLKSSAGTIAFTSKAQAAEFMASSIFVVTCRHEVYGTLFGNWAYEPYIMQSQLPLDFGPPAVNDFQALVGIAMATSRKPATKLMIREEPMPGEKTTVGLPKNAQGVGMRDFKYFIRNLPTEEDAALKQAFDYLQGALNALYVDMAGNREKREMANWFLQVTPEMLELGAGY